MTSLLAKEARELAGLVVLCSAACALIGLAIASHNHDPILPIDLFAVAVSASLLAAGRFAGEASEGTLPFLTSLPETRLRVWMAKAGVGLAGAAIVVVAAIAAVVCRQSHEADPTMRVLFAYPSNLALLLAGGLTAYFATLLCSACLESPALAAAAGMTLGFGAYVVAEIVGLLATGYEGATVAIVTVGLALSALLFAPASAAVFSLRETLNRRRVRLPQPQPPGPA